MRNIAGLFPIHQWWKINFTGGRSSILFQEGGFYSLPQISLQITLLNKYMFILIFFSLSVFTILNRMRLESNRPERNKTSTFKTICFPPSLPLHRKLLLCGLIRNIFLEWECTRHNVSQLRNRDRLLWKSTI